MAEAPPGERATGHTPLGAFGCGARKHLGSHRWPFRGRRSDLIKLLWFDGYGLCLFSKKLGQDISGMLEYLPASFKVIRHAQPRMCRAG
jgi:transposase